MRQKRRRLSQEENLLFRTANHIDLDSGSIFIYDEIDQYLAKDVSSFLKMVPYGEDVTVFINSEGGLLSAAQSIISDFIFSKPKITIDIRGNAYSAAAFIAMSGGYIRCSRFASIMFHSSIVSLDERTITEIDRDYKVNVELYNRIVSELFTYRKPKITLKEYFEEIKDKDFFLNPKQALKHKLIDEVY